MSEDMLTARDRHPELELVPTTYYDLNLPKFRENFDYVQKLDRDNKTGLFHILCKVVDGCDKFGLLYYSQGFTDCCRVAIPAEYDRIELLDTKDNKVTAIVQQAGKRGLYIWEYKSWSPNYQQIVPAEYDSFIYNPKKEEYVARKGGSVYIYDLTGHLMR